MANAPFLLSFLLAFVAASPSVSAASPAFSSDSAKVSLDLYYESLCPYSANFIVNYLQKIFEDGLISIVDLNIVPWGNARINSNNSFSCQHGPAECLLNTVEACAIHVWPELNKHFPFIYCVESLVYERKYAQWETCFGKLGLDPKSITDCVGSGYGEKLELDYAAETAALEPSHKYVPWVVVNGQPLYEDYEKFESYVCKAYNGTAVPKACSKLDVYVQQRPASAVHRVCRKEGMERPTISAWVRSAMTWWMDWRVDES